MYQLVLIGAVAFSICLQSCSEVHQKPYEIQKISPDGSYRVRITVTPGQLGKSVDKARFEFFRDQETIHAWDWQQEDEWDARFDAFMPVAWIQNNVFRTRDVRLKDGSYDELIIWNETDEYLKHVGISSSRYETFDIFDVAPGGRLHLRVSPQFSTNGTRKNSVGYSGITRSGKKFGDVVKEGETKSPSNSPLRFHITIKKNDLT